MEKNRLVIIGASEYGLQVLHNAKLQKKYNVVGFIDDYKKQSSFVEGVPIVGKINDIELLYNNHSYDCLFIAIGYKHFDYRDTLCNKIKEMNIPLATIIHPDSHIDESAKIGNGAIIYSNATIDQNVLLEDNVHIGCSTTVSHDSIIKQSSYISPCVAIAGRCCIGNRCFFGINSTIIDSVSVVNDCTIGAATLVLKPIEKEGTYVGVPAKQIKQQQNLK